jgi:RNA-directed DNA polymerase
MTKQPENTPAKVPLAQQAGDAHAPWRWVSPSVWTVRMLDALVSRVKGTKWFRLFDKVFSERNLLAAFQQVARNKGAAGVDHVTVDDFERQLPDSIWELSDLIKSGKYQPQAIRRVEIPKPGSTETRPLGIPTIRDRVVQAAILNVIEPIFERDFAEHSYGFRPGRGCKDALRRVDALIKSGHVYVVDADLKGYFDTIPHDRLMECVKEKITDGPVLELIESFLKADIMSETERWTPEKGAPQGAVLSPLLSNIYLNPLDHLMMDNTSPTNVAPDQDEVGRLPYRRILVPGLHVPRTETLAARQKSPETKGHGASEDQTKFRRQFGHDHQQRESHASRLVRILQTQLIRERVHRP